MLQGASTNPKTLNQNVPLLQEQVIRIVTDDRALYLSPGATTSVQVKVYEYGGPTTSETVVDLVEYMNVIVSQAGGNCHDGVRPNQTVGPQQANILQFPATVTIPAGQGYTDWFTIAVSASQSNATLLSYQLDPTVFGESVPAWSTANYSAIRVYANEDYSALRAKGPLQWADVYEAALRYYYLLFPAMSRMISLNLAEAIVAQGDLIAQRLNTPDLPGFFTTYNMPPTRTMSPAKVALVLEFIQQQRAATRQPNA